LHVALPFVGTGQGVHDEPQLATDESLRHVVPPSTLQLCIPTGHAPPPELDALLDVLAPPPELDVLAPLDALTLLEGAPLVPLSTT
jgi:hypothetical protein